MKFNLEDAVKRLSWRIGGNTQFKPNENDVEALNRILLYINESKKDTSKNHSLFTKLFIYHKTMIIRKYNTTVLDSYDTPNKEMIKLFKTHINVYYEAFHQDLHNNQLNKLVEYANINKKIDEKVKEMRSGEIIVEDFLLNKYNGLENYISHYKKQNYISEFQKEEIIKEAIQLRKTFTLDYVSDKLQHEATECLNLFSNYDK